MEKVVYVGDLDQDIDDIIAVEYLYKLGLLSYVVLDPFPHEERGKSRMKTLFDMGITVKRNLQPGTKVVFIGGALTAVASYIKNWNTLDTVVMNGGFVGCNILPDDKQPIAKFKGKRMVRTYNFNCDVIATDYVLKTNLTQIKQIILIGKNVCHHNRNTPMGIWRDKGYQDIFNKYHVRRDKLQHDMLACHEGICLLNNNMADAFCIFDTVKPYTDELRGAGTFWGSVKDDAKSQYRDVLAAICWKGGGNY